MDKLVLLMFVALIRFGCEAEKCPNTTQSHPSECNKYLKCVQLPSEMVSWITMQCQEGLIYDKNLMSCAIPSDDWECFTETNSLDDRNVYGVDNFDESEENRDDEFLEVIDDNLNKPEARYDTFSDDHPSGDGEIPETVTQSSATVRMITTQLQRLTQLMKHVSDKNDGVVDDEEITADDLNSFLAVQNIQSDSSDYQKIDFHSEDKTPMPSNGRIHPEILTDILDKQNQLNSEANHLTTLSMDATTPKVPQRKPVRFINDPITEIRLKSGQNSDGTGSHQIVVNRPEGSVLFNVPAPVDLKHQSPYLSEDILKTILEISKQMVTQNHQKQQPYAPQPFYYAVPIPVMSPQNNVQSFYGNEFRNNVTEAPINVLNKKPQNSKVEVVPTNYHQKVSEKVEVVNADDFGLYQATKSPQNSHQSYQNPNYYYQNYPQYQNSYQNYQQYSPFNYQYPQTQNQYSNPLNYAAQQQSQFDSAYYGNRPLVMESSAPSYVDQAIQQKPFKKESYAASYDGEEETDDADGGLYDEVESDDVEEKPAKEQLICSYVVQRQANRTDCYKYYVCNAKTKEVLSYSCPIFTAFNDVTKFCDALSYKSCKKVKDLEKSSSQNQRIYDEAHAALAQVKKESQKVERIASMVREESQKIESFNRRNNYQNAYQESQVPNSFTQVQRVQKPLKRKLTTSPPSVFKSKPKKKPSNKKKRKVKCRDIGNIVDPESKSSYWHCFRGADGRMKRINRKCAQNFIFCPQTLFCTSESRC